MGLKQIICIFLFSVSWISSFDIDQLQVTVNSKNVLIKVPDSIQLSSAFFHIEAGDECSLGYTFANNASSNIEFNQELGNELNNSDTLRILGIFENNGTVLRKVYDFKIDNGKAVRLDSLPECHIQSSPYGKKSITIVNDNEIEESDKLIYEENFETSESLTKFRKEVRSRVRTVNNEFVAFVDNNITCSIESGILNITAVLVQDKKFNVTDKCTAKRKFDYECGPYERRPGLSVPALYSAFLSSKFTFKYGRVDIRAQLPDGDYLLPYLILQNLETESDYASHMRIAFSRNNRKIIRGGVYIGENESFTPYESGTSLIINAFSGDFHKYSIIWRKNIIIFQVDDFAYGWITKKSVLQAFSEKECFIGLGLTAGGKSHFSNDKIIGEGNAVDKYREHIETRPLKKPHLLIDYIRVFSVSDYDIDFPVTE